MIQSVIFDLYGTLIHLERDTKPFLHLAQRNRGINTRKAIRLAMTTDCFTLDQFTEMISLDQQEDLTTLLKQLQEDLESAVLFSDTISTLEALKKRNIQTAVISNLATPYKYPFFKHHLGQFFDVIVFSCDCGLIKPDPEIYQITLNMLKALPQQTLMVGDSLKSDVEGPARLGIQGYQLVRSRKTNLAPTEISSLDAILEKV